MLLSKTVTIKWNYNNKSKYMDLGYVFTYIGDEFQVNVTDLKENAHNKVQVQCDLCGKIFEKEWRHYIIGHNRESTNCDACKDCCHIKAQMVVKEKYGVTSTLLLDDVKSKIEHSINEKYGVNHISQSQEIVAKRAETYRERYGKENSENNQYYDRQYKYTQTMQDKYGVNNPTQSSIIMDKIIKTNLNKYGCEYYLQTDEKKIKSKQTCLDKYGYEYASQSEEVKAKVQQTCLQRYGVRNIFMLDRSKKHWRLSMYNNRRCMCSKGQATCCEIYDGILNYPIGKYFGDIYIAKYNLIIEYDGSGHDLSVRRNIISQEEFTIKERQREEYIINQGYRILRLITQKDIVYDTHVMNILLNTCIKIMDESQTKIMRINLDDI